MAGCPEPIKNGVPAFLNCYAPPLGLQPYGAIGNGTISGWIATAVAQSKPAGANNTYATQCEAHLRARGLLYSKNTPGDCGAPPAVGGGVGVPQVIGLSGQVGSSLVSGLGVAGVIGGAATLGIGAAIAVGVGVLETVLSHHSAAVANEQATICAVMNFFNPIITRIDAAVKAGTISSDEGITYLQQAILTAKNSLSTIVQTCNAACFFRGYLDAHLYFAKNYYPAITPSTNIFAQAPGNPPDAYGTMPGGVTVTGNTPPPPPPIRSTAQNTYAPALTSPALVGSGIAPPLASNAQLWGNPNAVDYLNRGYNQQTGQSAQAADVPPTEVNWNIIGAVAAVIALLIVVGRG